MNRTEQLEEFIKKLFGFSLRESGRVDLTSEVFPNGGTKRIIKV